MIPLKSNLGSLLHLKERSKGRNVKGRMATASVHQPKCIAARDAQIQKLKAKSIGRRRKLVLPAALVRELELEDIVKIGQAGQNSKALVFGD